MLTPTIIYMFFATLILSIFVHRMVGGAFNYFGTPRIIGDIVAGCLLGPTIMGVEINQQLFPPLNRNVIKMFGQFGLILTSMVAGFSFDRRVLKGRVGSVVLFTLLNMGIPTALTIPLVHLLPDDPYFRGPDYNYACYFTLVACAMSSSALPMVFLILDELKVDGAVSRFAIGWSCLSTIGLFTLLSTAQVLGDPLADYTTIIMRVGLLLVVMGVLAVVQKSWTWLSRTYPERFNLMSDDMTIVIMCLGLGSAVASERLGYTFLLGAFLAGAAMPFDLSLRSALKDKIKWMTRWIFLPQFFLDVGLSFNMRNIPIKDLPAIFMMVAFAFASKATLVPMGRYLMGLTWREATFCASLANCRGFNALIIASTGRALNQIGDSFFTACVLLSLFSTAATGPLAKKFRPIDGPPAVVKSSSSSTLDVEIGGVGGERLLAGVAPSDGDTELAMAALPLGGGQEADPDLLGY